MSKSLRALTLTLYGCNEQISKDADNGPQRELEGQENGSYYVTATP